MEMVSLHRMWPLVDGLPEPVDVSIQETLADTNAHVFIGEYEGYPFGFLIAFVEGTLPQAGDERIGAIRFVYVDEEARAVGVGEAMRDAVLVELREMGITRFDAYVLPGHRLAKNFFEAGGFAARSIVMHHDDNR